MDDEEGFEGHDEARDVLYVVTYQNGSQQKEPWSEEWKNKLVRRIMNDRDNEDAVELMESLALAKRQLNTCAYDGHTGSLALRPWMTAAHLGAGLRVEGCYYWQDTAASGEAETAGGKTAGGAAGGLGAAVEVEDEEEEEAGGEQVGSRPQPRRVWSRRWSG